MNIPFALIILYRFELIVHRKLSRMTANLKSNWITMRNESRGLLSEVIFNKSDTDNFKWTIPYFIIINYSGSRSVWTLEKEGRKQAEKAGIHKNRSHSCRWLHFVNFFIFFTFSHFGSNSFTKRRHTVTTVSRASATSTWWIERSSCHRGRHHGGWQFLLLNTTEND